MARSPEVRFIVQQGLPEPAPHSCSLQYDALAFQPRVMAVLVAAAAAVREPSVWAALAALLLLGAAAPRLNPFDALHSLLARRLSRRVFLPGARAPRRFAQLLAALFCLTAALGLLTGREAFVRGIVAAFGAAFVGIFAFGFCFGAWLFRLLVPSWKPPQERPARPSTGSVPAPAAARAEGAASPGGWAPHAPRTPAPVDEARASLGGPCRTPPRTPHASSPSSQPLAGLAGGAELRTPPRTPHASSPSSQPLAVFPADRV